jgi:hypothetical protein
VQSKEGEEMNDIILALLGIPMVILAWFGVGLCIYAIWKEVKK